MGPHVRAGEAGALESSQRERMERAAVLSLLVVLCGISGWVYEMLFYRIDRGEFIRRGQGVGPWLPIYAVGGILILLVAWRFREKPLQVFVASGVMAGTLEFTVGWVLYNCFHGVRLWDYNTEIWNWGNIGGYVCARSVLVFAASGCLLLYVLIPALRWVKERIPEKVFCGAAFGSLGLFLLDLAVSYGRFLIALIRG